MNENILTQMRTEPGSIGDTARAYANSFSRIVTEKTINQEVFNNGLHMTLMYRAVAYENTGLNDGNLLLPVHTKGINEVYRIYDMEKPFENFPFKIDLPTMTVFTMLLESDKIRRNFAALNQTELLYPIGIIYEEIQKICPYQCIVGRLAFDFEITFQYMDFLTNADKSLRTIISARINRK